jgi:hypothetical protein
MPHMRVRLADRSIKVIGLTWIILVALVAGALHAQIPKKINYQGLLVDSETQEPLAGLHSLVFRIYDLRTGGVARWTESRVETVDSLGVISLVLGSLTPINIAFSDSMWLEVQVDGQVLSPRRQMVSVPFAYHAANSDSLGGRSPAHYIGRDEVGVISSDMIIDGPGSNLDADLLDGHHADAFAVAGHTHDDRYYTEPELNTAGTINQAGNPVDWTKLKGVPAGFADAVDDTGSGNRYSLDASDGSPKDALYVDQDGKVGIGTQSPTAKLHVAGGSPRALVEASSGNPEVSLKNTGDSVAKIWTLYKDNATDDLRFYQNGDRVVIKTTGNVGIGTTSPTQGRLQVQASSGAAIRANSSGNAAIVGIQGAPSGTWEGAAVIGASADSTGGHFKGNMGITARATGTASTSGYAGTFVSTNYRGILAKSEYGYYDAFFGGTGGIYASGYWYAAAARTVVINGGTEPLEPGDIVAIAGTAESRLGTDRLLAVSKATPANAPAVVGVAVTSMRAEVRAVEGTEFLDVEPTEGSAAPGGYLAIVTSGLAPAVKVEAASAGMKIGDWLAVSATPGAGKAVGLESGNSMPALGKVAGPVDAKTQTVPVFVILR